MADSSVVPPASGKSPMVISGMATRLFGVTTRKREAASRPRPPPMTTPWPKQSTGLGKV